MKRFTWIAGLPQPGPGMTLGRGFTLIERALVLMVIGFIASGALNIVGNSQVGKRTTVTN
ncbi:MAG: type II secretion system protein, partial [Rhodospirillaceae bacterium]|nr:type II secretion system protein [Rhodospirillaceae bacterium]